MKRPAYRKSGNNFGGMLSQGGVKPSFIEKADPLALVCGLPEGDRAQRRMEIQALLQNRTALTRHADGVELQWAFSEETARSLLEFIFFERTCCKTFSYELGSRLHTTKSHCGCGRPQSRSRHCKRFTAESANPPWGAQRLLAPASVVARYPNRRLEPAPVPPHRSSA